MRNTKTIFAIFTLLISFIILESCEKDKISSSSNNTKTQEINEFIYKNMISYYYWNNLIPNINPDNSSDSKAFFNSLLNDKIDEWSYITDDYQGLINYFNGIQLSMGMSFQLYYKDTTNTDVIGLIEYVDAEGPANLAGIKRGDIFYAVDNNKLNASNYYSLLTQDNYTISFCDIINGELLPLSPSISLNAVELTVNPIHQSRVIDLNGTTVGYLVLTAFQSNNETDLKNLFADFKSQNISELILDLRYNGGGYISTAKLLASMIGPSSITDEIMYQVSYNNDYEAAIVEQHPDDDSYFIDRFIDVESNLNLNRLFVLTSSGTASASELVMYCLESYMDVIQIGKETVGKYYGSITIPFEEYNWAIQPLILRLENVNNSVDYTHGLVPDYEVEDDYDHELGDDNEELLAQALSLINSDPKNTSLKNKTQTPLHKLLVAPLENNRLKKKPITLFNNSDLN